MIYIPQAKLFSVSGVDTQIPSQNIYPPPPYFPRSSPHSESEDSDLIPPNPGSDYESG